MVERRRFRDQHYGRLRRQCLQKKALFVDTEFPPTNVSLFLNDTNRSSDIEWKRPAELHENPHLFVEGASANDVTQGILGNCWFVSACSALTHNQHLLDRVIPDAEHQEWMPGRPYAGIFRFCFWRFGEWVEVVIDDLLPTRRGKLLFARSKTENEFWSALLEKAFAKLYGCYENLVGGHLSDALQDVSGGVAVTISVPKLLDTGPDASSRFFNEMKNAFDEEALIVAAIAAKTKEEIEKPLDCGLVKGHAYALTAIRTVDLQTGGGLVHSLFGNKSQQRLVRLQNPWGEKEWNGPWSDGSAEWEMVTASQKASLGIITEEDGDFWMPWESFVQWFTDISVCQLFNTSYFSLRKRFHEQVFFSQWTTNGAKSGAPNDLAGGCQNFSATFLNNPQVMFDITESGCDVMFALTQKEQNEGAKKREPYVTIGMHAMRVENNRKHRIHQPTCAAGTSDYCNARSVYLHLRNLDAGRYIVLPTTFAPREEAHFMLRIYSDQNIHARMLKRHAPTSGFCGCTTVQNVTRITIFGAEISSPEAKDYYLVLVSGKRKERTSTRNGTHRPYFNEQFVFHRKERRQVYNLELWEDRRMARDRQLCSAEFTALVDNENKELEIQLSPKTGSGTSARVTINISAFEDPMYL